MRELAWLGLVALLASAGSYYSSSRFGVFGWANLIAGTTALAVAFALCRLAFDQARVR